MDLILDNFAQTVQPLLLRADTRMLAEAEILQSLQIPANAIRQEPSGRQKEVRAQPGPAFSQMPLRRRQLVVVQRREQTPVVVEHRGHPQHLHRGCVKQYAEVAVMPVDVQNQGVQDAHPAEGVLAADPGEKVQELRDGPLGPAEDGAGFGQSHRLAGEQRAFADEFAVIVGHVIRHSPWAQLRRQLGGQILRKGLDLIVVAAALVELDAALRTQKVSLRDSAWVT